MQDTLTFPTLHEGSPPRFTFPELLPHHYTDYYATSACCSEWSSSTSTPFVSAPSSPSRTKAFYFSAPTSPSCPQRSIPPPPEKQGFDFPCPTPLYDPRTDCSEQLIQSPAFVNGEKISCSADTSLQAELHHSCSCETEHHESISQQADHTRSGPILGRRSLHAEHNRSSSWTPQALHSTQIRERTYSLILPQTKHPKSSPFVPPNSYQAGYQRSSGQYGAQQSLETEHPRNPASLQSRHLRATSSSLSQYPQPVCSEFANHEALKRLQVEDSDASYSRLKSFYASAVPFSWEEKPGTPKARSITSEASNGEDDSPSNLLSGSSEFEFSARFSELEDPPMSPTPISSPFNSFKHQYACSSPSPTRTHSYLTHPGNEEQLWPLRPPPCLENPGLRQQPIKDEGNQLKCSHGSLASLSTPQSPRSPRRFDIKGALCGISGSVDAAFDPFLTAMEKSMTEDGDYSASEVAGKISKKKANRSLHGHLHRRAQSLSPLRVFHWDDHATKSNSSSNGSSNMDEVKNKHPIQREINARHSAGAPKGLKKWSFKGFLHRKSVSGVESTARHSNMTSASLRSSGRESCSSMGTAAGGEGRMDVSSVEDTLKTREVISPTVVASMESLSSSSSNSSSKGKLGTNKSIKGPYAYHYGLQQAHTEELRKKTFLPYKQGLLGCLGLSSRSYRALASLSKPLQPVS